MSELLRDISDQEFDQMVQSGVCLVDFWAPWCAPCKMQTPILEEVAKKIGKKASIFKVNVDDHGQKAQEFGISSIPTLLLFKNGEMKKKFVGIQQEKLLLDAIDSEA